VNNSKEALSQALLCLKAKIEDANILAVKCLENAAFRRRNEFEKLSRQLMLLTNSAYKLKDELKELDLAKVKSVEKMAELAEIQGKIESLLRHGGLICPFAAHFMGNYSLKLHLFLLKYD